MKPSHHELLREWVEDALTAELTRLQELEDHARRAAEVEALGRRLDRHVAATRRHIDLLQDWGEQLGGVSGASPAVPQPVEPGKRRDTLLQNLIADYAAECHRILRYTALIELALRAEVADIIPGLEEILEEEEEMATWIEDYLPNLVERCAAQAASPQDESASDV